MENLKEKEEVIRFAQKLNSTNLSPLRSGNVSLRVTQNNVEGFLLTPSGIKYETLKPEDIVFLALKEKYDNLIVKNLQTKFSLPNKLVVPKFLKIVLNMGLGASGNDKKILQTCIEDMSLIYFNTEFKL